MKQLIFILFLCLTMLPATAQTDSSINKTDSLKKYADATTKNVSGDSEVIKPAAVSPVPQNQSTKPQVFNSGFIDFQNSGQRNASARVFQLYIGEPGKFMLPLSVYSGVSGNNPNISLGSSRGSEQMILGLINPMSGVFNISIENTLNNPM